MKKTKYFRFESPDGEIHFQECNAISCLNAKVYEVAEALQISKNEAKKPLILNETTAGVRQRVHAFIHAGGSESVGSLP